MKMVLIDARSPNASRRLFSLTLLERLLRQLHEMGVKEAAVILPQSTSIKSFLRNGFAKRYKIQVQEIHSAGTLESVIRERLSGESQLIMLEADGIYDERVIRALLDHPKDLIIFDETLEASPFAVRIGQETIGKILQNKISLKDLFADDPTEKRSVQSMNAYIRFLRKTVTPVLLRVNSTSDLRAIENDLFAKTYKGGLELIGTYGYRIPVRGLTRLCAKAGITPNFITGIATVCRFGAIPFLATGWLWTGLLFAAVFIILDSLDGKLARLTWRLSVIADKVDHWGVLPSRIGYYAAMAYYFSGGEWNSLPVISGAVLIAVTLIDDINWSIAKKYFNRSLYDLTELDARVHLFTIRRNDIFLLLIGLSLGLELYFYYFLTIWMVTVWIWHVYRLIWVGKFRKETLV